MAAKKEVPIRAIFDGVHDLSAEDVAKSESFVKLLKEKTPAIIEAAHRSNSTFATMFEINDSGCFIQIHRNDWVNALDACVSMYAEKEDYETCSKIKALTQEIKDKIRKLGKK
jgi:hypothetical protein